MDRSQDRRSHPGHTGSAAAVRRGREAIKREACVEAGVRRDDHPDARYQHGMNKIVTVHEPAQPGPVLRPPLGIDVFAGVWGPAG